MAGYEWHVVITPSVSVFLEGQTETVIIKMKQMVDIYMKIHVVIDSS